MISRLIFVSCCSLDINAEQNQSVENIITPVYTLSKVLKANDGLQNGSTGSPYMEKVKVLIPKAKIQRRIAALARKISKDYKGKDLVLIGVLKGAFVFLAELVGSLSIPVSIDFIQVASYGASTFSSGVIKIKKDIDLPIVGKEVLIVEDIIDYGYTLDYLLRFIAHKKPKSVRICALLDKPSRRKVKVPIAYKGFTVPDKFIVGFGLDLNEKYRNLPYVGSIQK